MKWMIYGASGYTGELIAREAKRAGMSPLLAGRSAATIPALAAELGFGARVFSLADPEHVVRQLEGVQLVLNCAGPFSATAARVIEACIAARAHYLDITGEIDVLEHAQRRSADAERAGVVICGGVGFDVIPTDCVAAALARALPDATRLALGFHSRLRLSPGTARSSVEGLARGNRVRRGGELVEVPLAHRVRRIDFGDGRERLAMTLPWGDVATAFYTTGIPDVETFISTTPAQLAITRRVNTVRGLLARPSLQALLKAWASRRPGPSADERAATPVYVWGEAVNASGASKTARIQTPNGYDVTVHGALAVVRALMERRVAVPRGSTTPARLLGPELVSALPGVGPLTID